MYLPWMDEAPPDNTGADAVWIFTRDGDAPDAKLIDGHVVVSIGGTVIGTAFDSLESFFDVYQPGQPDWFEWM